MKFTEKYIEKVKEEQDSITNLFSEIENQHSEAKEEILQNWHEINTVNENY